MNKNTQSNTAAAKGARMNSIRCLTGLLGTVLLGASLSNALGQDSFFDSASSGSVWDATTTLNWGALPGGPYNLLWVSTNVANFEGTPGTVNVSASDSPTCTGIIFPVSGYTLAGGTIRIATNTATGSSGQALPAVIQNPVVGGENTISSVIADVPGESLWLQFRGGNFSTIQNITGINTFSGDVHIRQCKVQYDNLVNGGVPGPFGQGTGPVTVGVNASAAHATYVGAGNQSTDRPFLVGGTGGGTIENKGFGPISFTYEGSVVTGNAGNRTLSLGGDYVASPSYFAGALEDMPGFASTLQSKGSFWIVLGTNSHSVNNLSSGSGTLGITSENALGNSASAINFTASGTLGSISNDVTISSSHTITVSSGFNANFKPLDSNNLTVAAYITGAGGVKKQSASWSLGMVRFSNDANDYTGNFQAGFGTTEFTSVANAGVPSSLGAGAAIRIENSVSAGTLRYVGALNSSTTRSLDWANTTGGYRLDASGAGTVAFLAAGTLKSGLGSATLYLQGSNTGTNTLAQVVNDSGGVTALTKTDAGSWTLSGANTYSGDTLIDGGTLALTGSGTIGAGTNLIINAGGTFDVSALGGGYTLGAGTGLWVTDGATASVNGSLNAAAAAVTMSYAVGTPTVNVTGGALTLGGSTPVTVDISNGGSPLGAGSYKLVSAGAGGSVAGTAPSSVTIGGDGLDGGTTAALSISGGELYLNVTGGSPTPPVITGYTYSGGTAVLGFSGPNGQSWQILTSPDITTPFGSWTVVDSGTFAGSTVFYTNSALTDPKRFYIITSP